MFATFATAFLPSVIEHLLSSLQESVVNHLLGKMSSLLSPDHFQLLLVF
jgi:hypothetical protein